MTNKDNVAVISTKVEKSISYQQVDLVSDFSVSFYYTRNDMRYIKYFFNTLEHTT